MRKALKGDVRSFSIGKLEVLMCILRQKEFGICGLSLGKK